MEADERELKSGSWHDLPRTFRDVACDIWSCPGREAARGDASECGCTLKTFDIGPDTAKHWGPGWGNPFAPVWFVGINPQIPVDKPERWGEYDPRDWTPDKALSTYDDASESYNARHFRYHQAILDRVAHKLYWPECRLSEHAFLTEAVICGSPNARELSDHQVRKCSDRHLIPLIQAMNPAIIVPIGRRPLDVLWQSLSGAQLQPRQLMRDLAGRLLRPLITGDGPAIVPMPQPRRMRWTKAERDEAIARAATAIAQEIGQRLHPEPVVRLRMAFAKETYGEAIAVRGREMAYSGPKPDLVRRIVEEMHCHHGLTGGALLESLHRSPQSYFWTAFVN